MPIPYTKTRFYIDQHIYDEYIKDCVGADLVINIVPQNARVPHSKGRYTIPFDIAVAFIKSKKYVNNKDGEITKNWRNNNNWHSAAIPTELIQYFNEEVNIYEEDNINEEVHINEEDNINEEVNIQVRNNNYLQIANGDVGYSYEDVFKDYLVGAEKVTIEEPYIRKHFQIEYFLRLAELIVKIGDCIKLHLITSADNSDQQELNEDKFDQIKDSLEKHEIEFTYEFEYKLDELHDREIRTSNGWKVDMGRGLDYFKSPEGNYFQVGQFDHSLRACKKTHFSFHRDL